MYLNNLYNIFIFIFYSKKDMVIEPQIMQFMLQIPK